MDYVRGSEVLADESLCRWFASHAKREFPNLAVAAVLVNGVYRETNVPLRFEARAIPNSSEQPLETWSANPEDLLKVDRYARRNGLEIYGIAFSRKAGHPATPSRITREGSAPWWPVWIASVDKVGNLLDNQVYQFIPGESDFLHARREMHATPESAVFAEQGAVLSDVVQIANDHLMQWLANHPEELYRVHPGTFELIVAEIFRSQGYEVEVVGQWNQSDGGIDIIAIQKSTSVGSFRVGIQCKRYTRTKRVRADLVWALEGRLDKFHLHKGVLATTARFETSTLKECSDHLWRVELRDFERLRQDLELWGHYRADTRTGLWLPKG